METKVEVPTLVKVEAVLMPNGEVICSGETIGWQDDISKYIELKDQTIKIIVEKGMVQHVIGLPSGCTYEIKDRDNA